MRKAKPKALAPLTDAAEIGALLRQTFPSAFCSPPLPLAIGIYKRILDTTDGAIDPKALSSFLAAWTNELDYVEAVARGGARVALDGGAFGYVRPDERVFANKQLADWRGETALPWIENEPGRGAK